MRKLAIILGVLMSFLGTGCASYRANFDGWFSKDRATLSREFAAHGDSKFTDSPRNAFHKRNQEIAAKVLKESQKRPDPVYVIVVEE